MSTTDLPDFPMTTQKTLYQRLDARMFDPEVRRSASGMLMIYGKREDEIEPGAIDRVHVTWWPDGKVTGLIRRRGEPMAVEADYTTIAAELKTGERAQTGEHLVRTILRGLFSHTEKTTKAEQAAEKQDRATIAAAKKAAAQFVKENRAAMRAQREAAKAGMGEDVSE
jgi:hypothetical protein